MEKKTTESTIMKFYNYFMNSPKFKRAKGFSWIQEPGEALPFLYFIVLFIVSIFAFVMASNGKNIGDEKYIIPTFGLMFIVIMFLSMFVSILKLFFLDDVTDIGSYDDVMKLKKELEFLIKSILCKRVDNDDKFHFVAIDYKRLIHKIAAILIS